MFLYPYWDEDSHYYGYINEDGNIIIRAAYNRAADFREGLALAQWGNQLVIVDEKGGKTEVPGRMPHGFTFHEGVCPVWIESKWRMLDSRGELVSDAYDSMDDMCDGRALVTLKGKRGYIDRNGELCIPLFHPTAVCAEGSFHEGLAATNAGYVNPNNEVVIPLREEWERMGRFSEGIAFVRTRDSRGEHDVAIDRDGHPAFKRPAVMHAYAHFSEGLAPVKIDGRDYFLARDGELVPIEVSCKSIGPVSGGRAMFKTDRAGYLDKLGAIAVPAKYRVAHAFEGPLAMVEWQTDSTIHREYIDRDGRIVFDWTEQIIYEGRPLRVAGRVHTTEINGSSHFVERARAEHASMAAFFRLGLQLLAAGADSGLIARVADAARDEERHTRLCLQLAGETAEIAPLPQAIAPLPQLSRQQIARDSLIDGCINEGLAAARLAEEAEQEHDPQTRAILRSMAEDEARHAALAWDIVQAFACDKAALLAEIEGMPLAPELAEKLRA